MAPSILLFLIPNGLLALNSIIYPTFTAKYLGVNSLEIFTFFSLILLIFLFFNRIILPKKILQINKLVFPFLSLVSLFLIVFEKVNYPNYILEHLHIFPYSGIYLPILNGIIFYISLVKKENSFKRKIRVLFPIILIFFCYLWFEQYSVFWYLINEDSILEYLEFAFYLLAALGSFQIFRRLKNVKNKKIQSLLFLLLSVGLIFVSLEEISYGQRIFGWETPDDIQEINIQKETNIHNIFGYDTNETAYILVGLYGVLARPLVNIFFKKSKKELSVFTVPKFLVSYFLFLLLVYFDRRFANYNYDAVVNNAFRKYAIWDWLEIGELYLAIAFWAYTKNIHYSIKTKST